MVRKNPTRVRNYAKLVSLSHNSITIKNEIRLEHWTVL
jgi:hypothetical protein